ncbi:spermine/spermidine synthase domain-containing protein [Oceanobacillus halotolerans]|uniref:spermine/spermidine synthase domain-containing protein n=1 Tax=Oceanobacillus halotolerans TaxID=2663380 RepID=UPI0013DBE49F|nr:spermine/spermidine synthase [Oceanobacillus halotolerans]
MYVSPTIIDSAETDRGVIQLQKRGNDYEVISNGTFLMATYNGESERLLVNAAIEQASMPKHVLIGGLGVGMSLAETLSYSSIQKVTVIEIEERIIEWNKTYLADFSSQSLQDPRTNIVHADFTKWMYETDETFDAICLDIDNGPDWTVTDSNDALYQKDSLIVLASLLNENGILTFWSASAAPDFVGSLEQLFSRVEVRTVPMERGEPDYVFLASNT